MKHSLISVLVCLGLLAGCSPDFSQYPRVSSAPAEVPPQVLTMDIPKGADSFTQDAVARFAAAVMELSGGAITLETVENDNPLSALTHGATQLALADNRILIQEDPSLSFLEWPFLFDSREQYLTVAGAQGGPVRSSLSLQEASGGRVIGVWYAGSTILLGRGAFYEEICFSNSSLGVLSGLHGSEFFTGIGENLGAKEAVSGDPDELLSLLEDKTVKYLEYTTQLLGKDELPDAVNYLENTSHRFDAMWLFLGDGAVDDATAQILTAAAAYVPEPVENSRVKYEQDLIASLESQGIKVNTGEYAGLFRASREYFYKNHASLGCPDAVWNKIQPYV